MSPPVGKSEPSSEMLAESGPRLKASTETRPALRTANMRAPAIASMGMIVSFPAVSSHWRTMVRVVQNEALGG